MDRRHRVSGREWERILAEQGASGQSASQYCQERGIRASSFFSAKKRARVAQSLPGAVEVASEQVCVHPTSTSSLASADSRGAAFLPVQILKETVMASRANSATRVQLRSGHQLWVDADFDAAHLRRLVAVLESAS